MCCCGIAEFAKLLDSENQVYGIRSTLDKYSAFQRGYRKLTKLEFTQGWRIEDRDGLPVLRKVRSAEIILFMLVVRGAETACFAAVTTWRCNVGVTPARSPWRAHVACVPRLWQRQSFERMHTLCSHRIE